MMGTITYSVGLCLSQLEALDFDGPSNGLFVEDVLIRGADGAQVPVTAFRDEVEGP